MDLKTVLWGLLIPFIGTAAGAACVFFLKKDLKANVQRGLTGFAAGVMVAASIWSLIVPAIEQSTDKGRWAFLPAFIGFWLGVLSGAVEPVFGGITVLVTSLVVPAMPYLLSFAAGAMLYVVVEELIPEMSSGEHSNIGVIFFAVGFSLMMALDVALG